MKEGSCPMTNKQRRFLKKLYKMDVMSYDYLDSHYPNRLNDKELGSPLLEQYIELTPDKSGITISVEGIEELQDFHRYLKHWRVPVILSAVSIALTILSQLLPVFQLLLLRILEN